jgi:nucleotide-binding universal stress UspA family protein
MEDENFEPKVLVGVDGSAANRAALLWANREAEVRQAKLMAAYAWHVPSFVYYSPGYVPIAADDLAEAGHKLVEAAVGTLGPDNQVKIEIRTVEGPAHRGIRMLSEEPGIGLVVVGSRGQGALASMVLGSTSHALSHHCPKPLVIVPTPKGEAGSIRPVRRVLVGVDGSDGAAEALKWAAKEAKMHGAALEVAVAWCWTTMPPEAVIDAPISVNLELAARGILSGTVEALSLQDLEVSLTVREGTAPEVLLDLSESADLLVVGTRGRGRAREMFLGSTSHVVAHRSSVPVAIIPSTPEEVSE